MAKEEAYPEDELYQVSHETIYRSLFVQARGVLKKSCLAVLVPIEADDWSVLSGRA